jgi:hypothetical protein
MQSTWSATLRLAVVLAAAFAAMLLGSANANAATPGDETIVVPINDSTSGASYTQEFVRAFAGETNEGTPVYIYVPAGALDGVEGVQSLDPQWDPNPGDEFTPCATTPNEDYVITDEQIAQLGNELTSKIVQVDEAHFGPMGGSDALVVLVYNVQDDMYYDCAETTYTAGYFAPDYLTSLGMNVIVIDAFDWANRVGPQTGNADGVPYLYEGVIAHELEHLLMEYSDTTETSWVDEGLADMAGFLNQYPAGGSHVAYHQVFHRETSLIRWGGGLENYGASFTYFLYLWERAGGEGGGDYTPNLFNDGPGDRLIQLIFANQDDSLAGVNAAIEQWNANNGSAADLPSAEQLYQDWLLAVYLDDEGTIYDLRNLQLGTEEDSWGYTIDLANDLFWNGRGIYKGAMPEPKWRKDNVPAQVALPFGASYETFRNPGPTFALDFSGTPGVDIEPLEGTSHWWGGYANNSDTILDVDYSAGTALTFDSWYFIEEGWDYGFVEALVGGEWVTVPVFDAATGAEITTDENPHENNDEGNGITGTSGGEYFVDEPEYVSLKAALPAGTTDVRFRYSTDAAYLDAGWFVSNVAIDEEDVAVSSTDWTEIDGQEQVNNWLVQVVSSCDLTPGTTSTGESVEGDWHIYRLSDADGAFRVGGFDTSCLKGRDKGKLTVTVSNMPTGQLTVFDAPYVLRVDNTGNSPR